MKITKAYFGVKYRKDFRFVQVADNQRVVLFETATSASADGKSYAFTT